MAEQIPIRHCDHQLTPLQSSSPPHPPLPPSPPLPLHRSFAYSLLKANVSKRVGFIPAGRGGSLLNYDWVPTGNLWQDAVRTARKALAAWGPEARLRGMVVMIVSDRGTDRMRFLAGRSSTEAAEALDQH